MALMRTVVVVAVLQMKCCSEAFYLNVNTWKLIFTQTDTENILNVKFLLAIVYSFCKNYLLIENFICRHNSENFCYGLTLISTLQFK